MKVGLQKMKLRVLVVSNPRGGFRGGRGRGRNREVKCYSCGEIGHMSWNCPRNRYSSKRNVNVP